MRSRLHVLALHRVGREQQRAAAAGNDEEDRDVRRPPELDGQMPRNALALLRRHLRRQIVVLPEHDAGRWTHTRRQGCRGARPNRILPERTEPSRSV